MNVQLYLESCEMKGQNSCISYLLLSLLFEMEE